ncbi:MAG TPA: xanthine dehydrogenase accessory protein XdhC [Phycicoccus sp.]|nr:xanthine dehydrogenase accessory protein XdhC [Phycicoccus sp.]
MHWLAAAERLRSERRPGVLVTVVEVRGHAPREAGAKMVVAADATWGTVGGGNLEATAVERARALLAARTAAPERFALGLSEHAPYGHGRQCCGGEVEVLLEPLLVVPAVAVFGMGHVGLELARVLARQDLDLHLVDSREEALAPERLSVLADAVARVESHHAPLPELVLAELPPGTHVLVMTHDHAEDHALVDAALRSSHLGSVGLIGSAAKWSRFRRHLAEAGHTPADLDRVRTPIGLPDLPGKDPATIAVGVAADLLRRIRSAASPPARVSREARDG